MDPTIPSQDEINLRVTRETATLNFALLRQLPAFTKIYVDKTTGQMSLDNRWLSGARRYMDGSSRSDLVDPLKQTFLLMRATATAEELVSTFNHTRERLVELYPGSEAFFDEMEQTLFPASASPSSSSPPSQQSLRHRSGVAMIETPPPSPPPPAPVFSVRRRGSEILIQMPTDFEPAPPSELIPSSGDEDESTSGCNSCCQRVKNAMMNLFRGISLNKERSD